MNVEINRIERSIDIIQKRLNMIMQLLNMPIAIGTQSSATEELIESMKVSIETIEESCKSIRKQYIEHLPENNNV